MSASRESDSSTCNTIQSFFESILNDAAQNQASRSLGGRSQSASELNADEVCSINWQWAPTGCPYCIDKRSSTDSEVRVVAANPFSTHCILSYWPSCPTRSTPATQTHRNRSVATMGALANCMREIADGGMRAKTSLRSRQRSSVLHTTAAILLEAPEYIAFRGLVFPGS